MVFGAKVKRRSGSSPQVGLSSTVGADAQALHCLSTRKSRCGSRPGSEKPSCFSFRPLSFTSPTRSYSYAVPLEGVPSTRFLPKAHDAVVFPSKFGSDGLRREWLQLRCGTPSSIAPRDLLQPLARFKRS